MPGKTAIDAAAVLERVVSEGPDAQLTRGEAAAVVAARLPSDGNVRGMRNRVATRLDAALNRKLDDMSQQLQCLTNGKFTSDEIARWASRIFGPKFSDFPTKPRVVSDLAETTVRFSDECTSHLLPADVAHCHRIITELRLEIRTMKEEQARKEEERKLELVSRFHRD
ncbi:MAG: hypothetical protein WBP11_06025 [Dokdonella sp.]